MSYIINKLNQKIAYKYIKGCSPGIVFVHGLNSDMQGLKAKSIEKYAKKNKLRFLRFDCRGHGQSFGRFEDFVISDWKQDLLDVIDKLTKGPQILIGSSMGAWLMILAANARPKKIAGLIGLSAAADFGYSLHKSLSLKNKNKDWGVSNWKQLVTKINNDFLIIQSVHETSKKIEEVFYSNKKFNFRIACAILDRCDLFVGPEGGFGHAAAALNKKAVIYYGGWIHPRLTGYNFHENLYFDHPKSPCGARGYLCDHCEEARQSINVDFFEDKIKTANFFFNRVLPRIDTHYNSAISGSKYIMDFKFS